MRNWFLNASKLSKILVIASGTILVVVAVAIPTAILTAFTFSSQNIHPTPTTNQGKSEPTVTVTATSTPSTSPSAAAPEPPAEQKSDQSQNLPNSNQAAPQTPVEQAPVLSVPGVPLNISPQGAAWDGDSSHVEGGVTISFSAPASAGSSEITDYQFGVSVDGGSTWYFSSVGAAPGTLTAHWYINGVDGATISIQQYVVRAVNLVGNGPSSTPIIF